MMQGLEEFERDLDAYLTPEVIGERFIRDQGDEVRDALRLEAFAGNGPGGKRYPPYSKAYARRKMKAQGSVLGNWLRGFGGEQKMLDRRRFSWRINPAGSEIWLVWTAATARMGVYAEVHNSGKPIGRGGPVKKREWMHFDAPKTTKTVFAGMDQTLNNLAAEFSAGRRIK